MSQGEQEPGSFAGVLSIAAMAVVAYAIANVAHEGAHGIACVLVGGKPVALSAIYFDCDKTGVAAESLKWTSAAGTLANLLLAGVAFGVLSSITRAASTHRYFWWLFMTVNALQAGGYWLFSGVANIGDWARVIDGLSPHWLWRLVLAVVGSVAYFAVIRLSLKELGIFLAPGAGRVQQARRLTLVPYLVGGALYVTAGLLNPLSVWLVLISAAAASFGGTSAMAWMFNLVDAPRWSSAEGVRPFSPTVSRLWMAGALITAVVFIAVLGPSVTFASPMADDTQKLSSPTHEDLGELRTRSQQVARLLQDRYKGVSLTKSRNDVALLQRLVDDGVPAKTETYKLQSLGLVLGEVFAKELGFHWVVVEDQYGRDLALRYEKTSIILYPLTMISKRVEAGEKPQLASLFAAIEGDIASLKKRGL